MLKEMMINKEVTALKIPVVVFGDILKKVAQRAAEINDPKMNALMMKLALYECSNPDSKEYSHEVVMKYIEENYKDES